MSQEQPPVRSRRELRRASSGPRETNEESRSPAAGTAPDTAEPAAAPAPPAAGQPAGAPGTGRNRRVADGPVDVVRAPSSGGRSSTERSSQVRARDRAALRAIKELAEKESHLAQGGAPTRRQLRLQGAAETAPATSGEVVSPAPAASGSGQESGQHAGQEAAGSTPLPGGPAREGMTVEQALAARDLLARQARNQVAAMEHRAATDPEAVDPAVLAEQIALAERAAVLNRRAAAKQKLAEQNSPPAPLRSDPSAASNLAMVTPLEFVEVPGVDRPVMKRPATSYIPVVTHPGPRIEDPRQSAPRRPGATLQRDSGSLTGRAGVLARAEAAAKAVSGGDRNSAVPEPEERISGRVPVPADTAYGLDPLDASTAGLGRALRFRMLQTAVLALGVLACITGLILILTGLGR